MTDTVLAMKEKAAALRRAGRFAEAEHAYKVLLSNEPNLPDCWYNLALVQRHLGKLEDALACYQEALKLRAPEPEQIHLNRAVIYSDYLRQPDAAERELKMALRLRPDFVPAMFNLANLKEEHGDREGALALYGRVRALAPGNAEGLARWARLKALERSDEGLIRELRQGIANPRAEAADRATLGFTLGQLLDDAGAYDEAFEACVAANKASRAAGAQGAPLYHRGQHEQFVDRLIEAFGPGSTVSDAPDAKAPIFICGMFRSGSTLIEQVLARHPRVTAGGEIELLPAITRVGVTPFPQRMVQIKPGQLAALAGQYRELLSKQFPKADLVTDKRPDNFLYIGLIKALFPKAKIVHTTRHPLDNCLSVYFTHLDHGMGYALDLDDTAHYYRQYRRLMAHWKAVYGNDILDIDYDAFVRGPRPVVEKLLAFLGLDWHEACLSFHEATNAVKTASVWQVRKPLYTEASGRWRNYERHIAALRYSLADLYASDPKDNAGTA